MTCPARGFKDSRIQGEESKTGCIRVWRRAARHAWSSRPDRSIANCAARRLDMVIKIFSGRFSRCCGAQAVHVVRRKPGLPRFGTGVTPPAGTAFSVSLFLLLCSCGPAASFVVRAACFNMRPLLLSVGHSSCPVSFLLLFQASRHAAVALVFVTLGGVPAFAPVGLSVTILRIVL